MQLAWLEQTSGADVVSRAQAQVVIVGGGPVGLTMALDLAWRGIEVTVVEQRRPAEPPEPKCNHVSARSMEIYRRLGLARDLRDAGLPADYPNDIAYRTAFAGIEFGRIHIPCRRDRYTDKSGPDGHWPTPEPPHRGNQIFLEPIIFHHAAAHPRITILNRCRVEAVEERTGDVVTTVVDLESGAQRKIACEFLVGCDGGRSIVRRDIGAEFVGDAVIQRVQATFVRAPDLVRMQGFPRAWMTNTVTPRRSGNVIAIDGRERWMVFNYLRPDQADFEAVDRDRAVRDILGVDDGFHYEILSKEDWYGRRLIASRFRLGRRFIAGDAAHIWVPYGGYGMNAGIADATNLSWLLAAHLNGWAPAGILDAYEAERQPITEQVSRFAMAHAEREIRRRGSVPEEILAEGEEGDRTRAEIGRLCCEINVHQYCCGGLNFGAYYDASPIIAYDGQPHPSYSMSDFTPSTVPGCRTPHLWLEDGRSLYDAHGPEYTLLRLDPRIEVSPLAVAAAARKVPLSILDVAGEQARTLYAHGLVLSRPDQHVAWRGNACPADPLALIDLVRGAAGQR